MELRTRRTHSRTHARTAVLAATALAVGLALAGCSSGSASSGTKSPDSGASGGDASKLPDPCSLLTVDQISAAVGATVQAGAIDARVSQDGQLACVWTGGPDSPFPFVQVLITPNGDQLASQRKFAQDSMGDVTDVTIAGVDGAYSYAQGSTIGMAIKGYFVQVAYNDSGVTDYATPVQALATDVAAAL